MAQRGQLPVHRGVEGLVDHVLGTGRAERLGPQPSQVGQGAQLLDDAGRGGGHGGHHQDGEVVEPSGDAGEPAQRERVGVDEVVDEQGERPVGGQGAGGVQQVQEGLLRGPVRGAGRRNGPVRAVSAADRVVLERPGAVEHRVTALHGTAEHRVEELADHAVLEALLAGMAAGPQDQGAGRQQAGYGPQQCRPAGAAGPVDQGDGGPARGEFGHVFAYLGSITLSVVQFPVQFMH